LLESKPGNLGSDKVRLALIKAFCHQIHAYLREDMTLYTTDNPGIYNTSCFFPQKAPILEKIVNTPNYFDIRIQIRTTVLVYDPHPYEV
jgi:hypothetical protein